MPAARRAAISWWSPSAASNRHPPARLNGEGASAGEGRPNRLPRAARIAASGEIKGLFRRGKRKRTRHLDVFVSASPVSHARLGLVVPKHKHNSVQRNRLKRRLREIGRTTLLPELARHALALDVMVRARAEAYDAPFAALQGELRRVVEELWSGA